MAVERIPIWNKAVLNSEEAAEYCNLPIAVIHACANLAKQGRNNFPCFWSGTSIKIHRQSLDRWLEGLALEHHVLQMKMIKETIEKFNNEQQDVRLKRGRPRKIREKIM